jgi:hypothetical protein
MFINSLAKNRNPLHFDNIPVELFDFFKKFILFS